MAEIKQEGYIELREKIVSEWNKFALLDESDKKVYSYTLREKDWIHERETKQVEKGKDGTGRPIFETVVIESNPILEYEVVITGADVGSLPVTISTSTLSNSDDVIAEEVVDFTFESESDQITIKHKIHVPQVI